MNPLPSGRTFLLQLFLLGLFLATLPAAGDDAAEFQARDAAWLAYQQAYLRNEFDRLAELQRELGPHLREFTPDMRKLMHYARTSARTWPPKWWSSTRSSRPVSFGVSIWKRNFTANYVPFDVAGIQAVVPRLDRYGRRVTGLDVVVAWRPHLVESQELAPGLLSEIHDVREADLAEVIVWHELGHNYISLALPHEAVFELYQSHRDLFNHLQEFYADMTAIAHASPRARRVALMFRLNELDGYDRRSEHVRAAHAIGSILLAEFMANPDEWPSVRFPPAVPQEQVELNTIIYLYEHFERDWSLAEAQRLEDFVQTFTRRNGDRIFSRRGLIDLPSGQRFALLYRADRAHQRERDAWVSAELTRLIASGRADKLEEGQSYKPPKREEARFIEKPSREQLDTLRRIFIPQ